MDGDRCVSARVWGFVCVCVSFVCVCVCVSDVGVLFGVVSVCVRVSMLGACNSNNRVKQILMVMFIDLLPHGSVSASCTLPRSI